MALLEVVGGDDVGDGECHDRPHFLRGDPTFLQLREGEAALVLQLLAGKAQCPQQPR